MWATQAHENQICALALYDPPMFMKICRKSFADKVDLSVPLLVTGGRESVLRIWQLNDGMKVGDDLVGHKDVVSSVAVFNGWSSGSGSDTQLPFIVSGSEDNDVILWNLQSLSKERVLTGHEFDVTCVAVYYPSPMYHPSNRTKKKRTSLVNSNLDIMSVASGNVGSKYTIDYPTHPIIVSASMDKNVRLWAYPLGDMLNVFDDSTSHINCVAVADLKTGPVVFAGNGNCEIHAWSLLFSFDSLFVLSGHSDEIQSLTVFEPEGVYPVLASGSWDMTIRLWNLESKKHVKTLEGHSAEITSLTIFCPGGTDPTIVSGSSDTTVRILYDFLGSVMKEDVIMMAYQFDLNSTNSHLHGVANWPRTSELVRQFGPEQFFSANYNLFFHALRSQRADFLHTFLPLTRIGLVKSNAVDAETVKMSLLRMAIDSKETAAVRTIVDCWLKFLSTIPTSDQDIVYEPHSNLSMDDMLALAQHYPREFEKFICNLKLIPAKGNVPPNKSQYLFESEGHIKVEYYETEQQAVDNDGESPQPGADLQSPLDSTIELTAPKKKGQTSTEKKSSHIPIHLPLADLNANTIMGFTNNNIDNLIDITSGNFFDVVGLRLEKERLKTFKWLPLTNPVHISMLKAYSDTCETLDSARIFDSEPGKLLLKYAWRSFGKRSHVKAMLFYFIYVGFAATSIYLFESLISSDVNQDSLALALIIVVLCFDSYFVYVEIEELLFSPVEYLTDIWNQIDLTVIAGSMTGNILRIIYWRDTNVSRITLSLASIAMWFNVLYFLRAFESTGPLVSMILRIAKDMQALMMVLMLVIVGFSQAFWLISNSEKDLLFSEIDNSLLNSFAFMLGEYDTESFEGLPLESFGIFLSVVYMLVSAILLLNLLIALMGDSYADVKAKGLAQWRLEQAQLIIELAPSLKKEDLNCERSIYFGKNTDEIIEEDEVEDVGTKIDVLTKEIDELKSFIYLKLK